MKELEPVVKKRFRCDFCEKPKTYYTESGCRRHERICFYNPNRECDTCENNGFLEELTPGSGISAIDCYSCKTAEQCGGKSYIGTN